MRRSEEESQQGNATDNKNKTTYNKFNLIDSLIVSNLLIINFFLMVMSVHMCS